MAASNAPKHDFAPAWLKIPNENTRPAGSKGSHTQDRNRQQRRDENYYNRYGAEYPRGLNRQNSFDMYDASKRYSPSHASKYRHHSVEDDYYYNYASYGYPYPYPSPYNDHYSMQFGSQPSLQRRDMKYPPPPPPHPSRFGQMNGSYQGYNYYYDFFPPGEGFNTYGGGGHSNSKRSHYARDGRGESKESKDSDRSSHDDDDKDKLFNDDFPSLNGTDDDGDASAKTTKNPSSGGVWDNPPRAKFEDGNDLKNSTSGLYKVVPSKGGSTRKGSRDSSRVNGSLRDMSPLASVKSGSGREVSPVPTLQQSTTTQAVEIRRPKTVKTTGSQFIKTLRRENGTHNGIGDYDHQESNNNQRKDEEDDEEDEEEVVRNGVSDLHLDHDLDQPANGSAKILSSSMEKEFMFMRSLGWNPNETETEEITEDEKREFQRLTDKLQQQQQRNGRNRMLPKSWSPQHMAPYSPTQPQPDMNETLSSSDTDSDEDL